MFPFRTFLVTAIKFVETNNWNLLGVIKVAEEEFRPLSPPALLRIPLSPTMGLSSEDRRPTLEPALPPEGFPDMTRSTTAESAISSAESSYSHGGGKGDALLTPSSPSISRNLSISDFQEDWEVPPENVTFFDILDNLALSTKLEGWQQKLARQAEKVRKQQEKLRSSTSNAKDRVFEGWRKRLPSSSEDQLDGYKRRMRESVDRLGRKWGDATAVTLREKLSFIAGVLNVFISGYLIGGKPELFYYWFSAQLCYFMPIRYYTYHKRGYHYFLADMCYFVNLLLILSIWVFPQSKRLFIATYCLANGNNAVAIAMWRNSMVFHSLDKVTSLFIHIMPCVCLHAMVHLTPKTIQEARFPGVYAIKYSSAGSEVHYGLKEMIIWSSLPYAVWQLAYHFLITVRRREKIAAGRPTSFTWLRKSYGNSWIGKIVLSVPPWLQEPAFMLTQYLYAVGTMIACPIWFWHRWSSATFLLLLFTWSVYNGATYYIDVFGNRFQKELQQLQKEVAKWQGSPEGLAGQVSRDAISDLRLPNSAESLKLTHSGHARNTSSVDNIPALDGTSDESSSIKLEPGDGVQARKEQ